MLQILGVIRARNDGVEFWCADDPLETSSVMKELLGEASAMLRVLKDSCFQLVAGRLPPFVYRWKANMTLSSVRNLLDRRMVIANAQVCISIQRPMAAFKSCSARHGLLERSNGTVVRDCEALYTAHL